MRSGHPGSRHSGAVGDYRLFVECEPFPGACAASEPIDCGQTLSGNNGQPGSTMSIDQYPACVAGTLLETGPEYTYSFVAPRTGPVTVTLSNIVGGNPDVFVIEEMGNGCDRDDCIGFGLNGTTFDAVAGRTYYIVVDGFFGSVADYDLTVTCP